MFSHSRQWTLSVYQVIVADRQCASLYVYSN